MKTKWTDLNVAENLSSGQITSKEVGAKLGVPVIIIKAVKNS
jgi:hypothetical protein